MNKRTLGNRSLPSRRRRALGTLGALGLLSVATLVVYHNSLNGPFIFDDKYAIVDNPDIRHFATTLQENPKIDTSAAVGRPLLRVSLWINYALGGLSVRGYHALNLLLHLLAALALFALARRLLESPRLRERYGEEAFGLALASALLWTTHPLQTESVTYVVQRAEILGGFFYLLTLYGVARSADAKGSSAVRGWSLAAVIACLLGMASKETVATAPLLALGMDRIFYAPSWRRLWQARGGLYGALACTWIFQALLIAASSGRRGAVGFGRGMAWWQYAITQPYFLCRYLALSVWPRALTLDYGTYLARTVGEVAPYAAVVLLLGGLTLLALWRRPALGFCGLWFFLILAPTSSVVPLVHQTGAEHRMYLPLAGLIAPVVVGGYTLLRWVSGERRWLLRTASMLLLATGVVALGARTVTRNEEYRSELSIWSNAVDRCPSNSRAHHNLGIALANLGRSPEAIAQYEEALRLQPEYAQAHLSLGNALASRGRLPEAISQYEEALRLRSDYAPAHLSLGSVLASVGRLPEAIAQDEEALRLEPDFAGAHLNLGNALANAGRLPEAIAQYEEALRLQPDFAGVHLNMGNALMKMDRLEEAITEYESALRLQPNLAAGAHLNLGSALARAGRLPEAIAQYETALRLEPDLALGHLDLGNALASTGRLSEAIGEFKEAVRLQPNLAVAHLNLGSALASTGHLPEAIAEFEEALRLEPDFAGAHLNLGNALASAGRVSEAITQYKTALRLRPDLARGGLPETISRLEERQHVSPPRRQSRPAPGSGGPNQR